MAAKKSPVRKVRWPRMASGSASIHLLWVPGATTRVGPVRSRPMTCVSSPRMTLTIRPSWVRLTPGTIETPRQPWRKSGRPPGSPGSRGQRRRAPRASGPARRPCARENRQAGLQGVAPDVVLHVRKLGGAQGGRSARIGAKVQHCAAYPDARDPEIAGASVHADEGRGLVTTKANIRRSETRSRRPPRC